MQPKPIIYYTVSKAENVNNLEMEICHFLLELFPDFTIYSLTNYYILVFCVMLTFLSTLSAIPSKLFY